MQELKKKLESLKKEKNAVILAHYYAPAVVQAVADHVGDSYYLAKIAVKLDAKTIVFAGVGFMGESVKILNPYKTVIMPDPCADCPMAHMASVDKIAEMRKKYDDLAVVCYINSSAELKSKSDVCVTSSNAVKIVDSLPNKNVYFIPDGNLGAYVAKKLPHKNIILNDGFCPIHASVTREQLEKCKEAHPDATVLTHPECVGEVLEASDFIGSTAEIIDYAVKSEQKEFIICTEIGVEYELRRLCPEKSFYFIGKCFECPDMKLNTLEKLVSSLESGEGEIIVSENVRKSAVKALDRMLELAR